MYHLVLRRKPINQNFLLLILLGGILLVQSVDILQLEQKHQHCLLVQDVVAPSLLLLLPLSPRLLIFVRPPTLLVLALPLIFQLLLLSLPLNLLHYLPPCLPLYPRLCPRLVCQVLQTCARPYPTLGDRPRDILDSFRILQDITMRALKTFMVFECLLFLF